MNFTQSTSMRQEMGLRQILTPRMIQSMEILQLPLTALEERIEQEMEKNPVLEMRAADPDSPDVAAAMSEPVEQINGEASPLVVDADKPSAEEFERLERFAENLQNEEFYTNSSANTWENGEDRDRKMDAMANTASRGVTLQEHLQQQWTLIECAANVAKAGEMLINYIDSDGYLRTPMEEIIEQAAQKPALEDLDAALKLVQTLEPAGVGARTLAECLLLQVDALEDEDDEFESTIDYDLMRTLIGNHLRDLTQNRYPQISRKLGRSIDDIKQAVQGMRRLHPHPGNAIGGEDAPPITPDATIYFDDETERWEIDMARDAGDDLQIHPRWRKLLRQKAIDGETKQFLTNNMRNAKWLIDSIQQRGSTIKRVIRQVVDAQREFFEKGPEYLRPLPMTQVADQLGIHVATVSRAVSEKYIQTPRGIFPLRRFFSGGTQSADGEDVSWDAVKEKLKSIIDNEDKTKPLNDDEIVEKLGEQGFTVARRTVAKYRKQLDIPVARQRREY